MTAISKSLAQLTADLQLFGPQITAEITELRRNAEVRPVTGATLFRNCLNDLNERLGGIGEDVAALEAVSLDAPSLEELVGHCSTLYKQNARAIAALETHLQSYGYRDAYTPLPPENPLDLGAFVTESGPIGQGPEPSLSPMYDDVSIPEMTHGAFNTTLPPSLGRYAQNHPPRSALEALAPMTAAKSRARNDTPSSISSPALDALTPSMRHLLGKYAATSSSSGLSGPVLSIKGASIEGSPLPALSPAFAAAAATQRAQLAQAGEHLGASYNEENTMELKAQVIFSRAQAQHNSMGPHKNVTANNTVSPSQRAPVSTTRTTDADGLQEAIAAALARNVGPTSHLPAPTTTPAEGLTATSARSALSTRPATTGSRMTPSLPSTVAPLRRVDDNEYSALPAFIRGQLPVNVLNEAAAAVHVAAQRRYAAGDGVYFTMDDVEGAAAVPSGKGKVVINALAKLGHVQLKVVYGEGTVYFFV